MNKYWVNKIRSAKLMEEPYPHIVLSPAIPAELYTEMLAKIPDASLYDVLEGSGPPPRLIFDLFDANHMARLSAETHQFWENVREELFGEDWLKLVTTLFKKHLREPYNYEINSVNHTVKLSKDPTNYHIGVHSDGPFRLISTLLYLPPDDESSDHGTCLYRPRDPSREYEEGPHYPREEFEKFKQIPYNKNSFFAFAVAPDSFHGLEPLKSDLGWRDNILATIRYDRQTPQITGSG